MPQNLPDYVAVNMDSSRSSARRRAGMPGVIILALGCAGYSGLACADGAWVDCVYGGNSTQNITATTHLDVPRDISVGDALGPWITVSMPGAWRCTHRSEYQDIQPQMGVQVTAPGQVTAQAFDVDGATYSVYSAGNMSSMGIGYVLRWRFTLNGQTKDWTPLTSGRETFQSPGQLLTATYNHGEPWLLGVETQIRFVRTSTQALVNGHSIGMFYAALMRPVQIHNGSTSLGSDKISSAFYSNATYIASGGTCTTPDVTVTLKDVSVNQFTGIGSSAAKTHFDLRFNSCPPNMNSIDYSFAATTPILDASNGVVALNAASTADGVGIQLLREDSTPVTFNSLYRLDSYSPTYGGNYTVPLIAGIYQTDNAVSAGSVHSAVTFTLNYK
ncbi:fimbrial protein [Entomohabitans teleogrylli]|uniref:fimbrial protein n=1 Tax=Entomohabitans teleogrylli TaxID=1384589 RepID=UPI00073DA8D7|nr:fimbrial protein [Entomohabitans teleogrylli]